MPQIKQQNLAHYQILDLVDAVLPGRRFKKSLKPAPVQWLY